jgi:predicted ATPase/DNA-binding winged helix-turn-helix (wHTH) protein
VTEDRTPTQNERSKPALDAATQTVSEGGASAGGDIISFGPFRLFPAARALEKDSIPIALGNRALDILLVLTERAGEVVGHRELLARVWRDLVVDPSNLRVHINGLRRVLGQGHDGGHDNGDSNGKERYIANVVGQGYSFVAPVRRESSYSRPPQLPEYPCGAARQRLVLPPALARMVGRDATVRTIAADLIAERFVTIIGPGGIGKTTVAVSVAHRMLEEFDGAVCFVDLSTVTNSRLVAPTIASKLGLTVQTEDVLPALMLCLRSLRVLLVLDNCEHVIEASATLAERIFQEAPGVHILATSREALRVEGEHAYWLASLESPPSDGSVKAADAMNFPAVKLFMERAAAGGSRFELTDADVSVIAGICGRLDGIPLAIEFAAARVGLHGLAGTSELLKTRFGLQFPGRRTAVPRHQTLHALLDWSYGLLSDAEQLVLRRLSIFVGPFTLEAAQAIACDSALDEGQVVGALEGLVAKSLVSAAMASGMTGYRLLETTRAYAREKLQESSEKQLIAQRHAMYFAFLLNVISEKIGDRDSSDASEMAEHLGNMRASLEWAFDSDAESADARLLASGLAASSVPIFLELSLLAECHKWSVSALAWLDDRTLGSRQEMVLQEALAISATWGLANDESARGALTRAIGIAQRLGDTPRRLRLLVGLHIFLIMGGEVGDSLVVAEEFAGAARFAADTAYCAVADCVLGGSHHFMGHQEAARRHLERGLAQRGSFDLRLFGLETRLRATVTLGRVMWISGFPDRAIALAREALSMAEGSKPLSVCFSYLYTAPLFLWCGDNQAARQVLEKLMAHPNWHALPSLHATGFALLGALRIREGEVERGIELLRSAVASLRAGRQNLLLAGAVLTLAKGLAGAGRFDEALSVLQEALADTHEGAEMSHLPELLRVQGEILFMRAQPDEAGADVTLERALNVARQQGALSWELRGSITLARLRSKQGRGHEGRELVASVYARFTEGFGTPDLRDAKQLLETSV